MWPPVTVCGGGKGTECGVAVDGIDCTETGTEPGAVIDQGDDLDLAGVGEVPVDVVELPALVGSLGSEAAVSMFG